MLKFIAAERLKRKQQEAGGDRKSQDYRTGSLVPNLAPAIPKSKARNEAAKRLGISHTHGEKAAAVVKVIDQLEQSGQAEPAAELQHNRRPSGLSCNNVTRYVHRPFNCYR